MRKNKKRLISAKQRARRTCLHVHLAAAARATAKSLTCLAWVFIILGSMAGCGNQQGSGNPGSQAEGRAGLPEGQGEDGAEEAKQPGAETETDTEAEAEEMKMKIQVGDTEFTAALAENSSVDALKELMADGSLTLNMSDYAGMEKGADLGAVLPQNNEQMNTQAGDIILYQGRTLVIYYDTNSWSLTPIGKIEHTDPKELRKVLGTGDVSVTFSLE